MSRTKSAFKNLLVTAVYEILVFALGIIFPRLIILSYGDSINGLTSTITRMLSLVNLLQAGAVGAAIYQMYKPVAENDYETQSSIIYASMRFYNRMGIIYLIISVLIAVFYGIYLQDENLHTAEVILSFILLALNGSLTFFFSAKYDIFLSAHQMRYYRVISNIVEKIVYYGLLIFVIKFDLHFIFMYISFLAAGIAGTLFNSYNYKRFSKGIIVKNPKNKNYIISGKKYLMLSCLGNEAINAAPTVIITTFNGLVQSSIFSIYSMIYTSIRTIIDSIHLSISAVFGNLVTTSDNKRIADIFNILVYAFIGFGGLLAACTAYLLMPFIDVYTDDFSVDYSVPVLVIFIAVCIIAFSFRIVFSFVSTVYGLFKDTCYVTLTIGTVGTAISLICVYFWGMPYVMLGILFNDLATCIALVLIFKKKIAWFSTHKIFQRAAVSVIISAASYVWGRLYCPDISGLADWFVTAVIYTLFIGLIFLIYSVIFERNEISQLFRYAISFIRKNKIIFGGKS